MDSATTRTSRKRWNFATAVMAAAVAVLAGGVLAVPAQARDHGRGHGHAVQRHYDNHRLRSYGRPNYVYAPPPVYYAPPPGPPALDFVFPLHFR